MCRSALWAARSELPPGKNPDDKCRPGRRIATSPCSAIADGFNGFVVHLANHDVALCAVSRAPLAKLIAYKRRMGWSFPWATSFDTDFNFDFQAAMTEEQQPRQSSTTSAPWTCARILPPTT